MNFNNGNVNAQGKPTGKMYEAFRPQAPLPFTPLFPSLVLPPLCVLLSWSPLRVRPASPGAVLV